MRKNVFGRQFKRDSRMRKALFRGLMREIILNGQIKTTEAKAKAIKGELEKHVTKAKVQGKASLVHLQKDFQQDVALRLINEIAPKFKDRPGGYTRIIRLGNRLKDNAPIVIMEWVEEVPKMAVESKKRATGEKAPKKTTRKTSVKSTKEEAVDVKKAANREKRAPKKETAKAAFTQRKTQARSMTGEK